MNTNKTFGLLILAILLQQTVNYTFKDTFIIGIIPTLIFGAIWNLKNGEIICSKLDNQEGNLKKLRALTYSSIAYLIAYMIFLNIYAWPPSYGELSVSQDYFMLIGGITLPFPFYVLYHNIGFVTKGLNEYNHEKDIKFKIITSLILFPVGILWIQPKINEMIK